LGLESLAQTETKKEDSSGKLLAHTGHDIKGRENRYWEREPESNIGMKENDFGCLAKQHKKTPSNMGRSSENPGHAPKELEKKEERKGIWEKGRMDFTSEKKEMAVVVLGQDILEVWADWGPR